MKCLHRRQPPLNGNGLVHILTESFIQRVNRPGHTGVRKTFYQFQVTQNQTRLGGDTDFRAAPLQLGQQGPCPPIDFLLGIVRVSHRTDEQFLASVLLGVLNFRPAFHIQKIPPGFRVVGKAFHKAGIAILAGVGASHIGIDRIHAHRKIGLGEDAFDLNFLNDWSVHAYHAPK